ncbi:hypothetical protein SSP531S_59750 [Streptomyces spongiicola]|uniref:Uncharacterized protein n=1 Tax=Streptomyces spongiicola TaxID=1690221 RepID=A0A388T6D2_9ACTN|nr:hypothetical protein SSP531S_59750 [Streptomyces spongiicola]
MPDSPNAGAPVSNASRGRRTARVDAGLTFRQVLAADFTNLRMIGQANHGDPSYFNGAISGIMQYYRADYPHLL